MMRSLPAGGRSARWRRRGVQALFGWLAVGALLVACGSTPGRSAGPTPSAAAASCVANVPAVVGKAEKAASTRSPLPGALTSKLDAAARSSFKNAAAPGAIVGVRTPEGTWTQTYGVADPTTGAPMTTDMHVRIGSVTKTFTGTLILQLAQQKRLSLSDPISKYVAGIPNGDRITIAMLANMTSGIAGYYTRPFLEKYFGDPSTIFTPQQLVAYGVAASPIFSPGAKFDYSNTNTVLLGEVIEKVTGEPVAQVLQRRILTPLGLSNTSFPDTSPAIPAPYPQGYTLQGSEDPQHPIDATGWSPSFGWTAGGMISTLADMLTYDRALGSGQGLLSSATQTKRLDSFPRPAGYGLAIGCIDGWVGHTGELPGFNSSVYYDTASDTSVVVLVNSDIASGGCSESPTLTDNPDELSCSAPATRVFVGLSQALGRPFHPVPAK